MAVPVQINGMQGIFQIDTGSPDSELFGQSSDDQKWTNHSQQYFTPKMFYFGDNLSSSIKLRLNRMRINQNKFLEGRIGIDYFKNKISIFDFKNNLLCTSDNEKILKDYPGIVWSGAKLQQDRFLITGYLGNRLFDNLLFDTGASIFPILVPIKMYSYLTEAPDHSTSTIRQSGMRNGKKIVIFGKQAQRRIDIGHIQLNNPQVYLQPDDPVILIGANKVDGVVGSMAFDGKLVVIDLRGKPRFGVK